MKEEMGKAGKRQLAILEGKKAKQMHREDPETRDLTTLEGKRWSWSSYLGFVSLILIPNFWSS